MPAPKFVAHKQSAAEAAIVLVHGFGGDAVGTWGEFPALLKHEPSLGSWDVYSIGYSTSLSFDIAGIWTADPEIVKLGGLFNAVLGVPPLDRYKAIAILGHSMGGLMIQRGLLNDAALRQRVSHVVLYGTPSGGLEKASPFAFWKRQTRDMAKDSPFITALRREWQETFGTLPFTFVTVAGDRDEFVPSSSSLDPFPATHHCVVYGNHLEIVKPPDADHLGFKLAVKTLAGGGGTGAFDAARVAVESCHFQQAIATLWPLRTELDVPGLVALALALESVNRRSDAIDVLRQHAKKTDTDARGVLAGRLKRRWLAERRRGDAEEALTLYREALEIAEQRDGRAAHEQGFYHAINCAFMVLAFGSDVTAAREYATRALAHCQASGANDMWRHATEGEANIYLGDRAAAKAGYEHALAHKPTPREAGSMYQQAIRGADLMGDEELTAALPSIFGQAAGG